MSLRGFIYLGGGGGLIFSEFYSTQYMYMYMCQQWSTVTVTVQYLFFQTGLFQDTKCLYKGPVKERKAEPLCLGSLQFMLCIILKYHIAKVILLMQP